MMKINTNLCHHSGQFRDDESLILASLLVNDHPTPKISSPKDAKLKEGPRDTEKVNMDNFLNFVDAKSLKDENQRLKEEKLCKVVVNGSTATAKSVDVYLILSHVLRDSTTHYIGPSVG